MWGKGMLLLTFVSFASIGVIIGLLVLNPSPMGLMVGLALWLVSSIALLMKPIALFTKKTEHSEKLKQDKLGEDRGDRENN
jgi:F0F1-type ATP synthase assembly protein I